MEPTSRKLAFQEKEKVLCYHGPLLYEAKVNKRMLCDYSYIRLLKIVRVDGSASPVKYFVHYRGWKEKWDEWVQAESIVKLDEAGLVLQERLKTTGGTQVETDEIEAGEESTGEKSDESVAADGSGPIRFGKVVVPLEIVRLLNLDWRLVAKEHRLLVLPASPSAADLIADFRSKYRKKKMVGLGVFDQFTDGLLRFFDVCLGRALLFPFERCQLSDLMHQGGKPFSPATIYAPIHLLRMLRT
jgi:mortality factor 4-like protein 1